MTTVFVGGSRHVSRLPETVRARLATMVARGHRILVGDAGGVDAAVQQYLHEAGHAAVEVFCSGSRPRNNRGGWPTRAVAAPEGARGFAFQAAKDRAMAAEAEFGFMIWDGRSPGTLLNLLRLARAGRIGVLYTVPAERTDTLRSVDDWSAVLARCDEAVQAAVRARAAPEEWPRALVPAAHGEG